ncbi:class IV adenylate cyclase [Halovivax sp.]|uniref:class IV adenylate cyclase n=1 Tax=Halovivax sp. TaxID=1935978 RepID=UPI0025C0AB8C|nr:class IV adenylate cyclase [Halovivax sp.]
MYEVEVKVPASLDRVRDRLRELEATPVDRVEQLDTYYDAPHRTFAETDEALRIREERGADGRRTELTYKGPLVEAASKSREEVETGVDDGEAADLLFRRLGFDPAASVRKERERYRLDGYTVTLDAVEGVGEFVEVEREATSETLEPTREGAFAVLERLGLDPDDQIRTSYLGLLLESRRND